MSMKMIGVFLSVAAVLLAGWFMMSSGDPLAGGENANEAETAAIPQARPVTSPGVSVDATPPPPSAVKEFTMTAYYDETGIWYSLKEIAVKKGDTVRIKVTNTKGMHDVTIDEYGIKTELPLNEEQTIEFVADKVGDFVYYCSMPTHREKGQWGTLRVTE